MTKIRNDIQLQALGRTSGQGLEAGVNAAGRPIITIPLAAGEVATVSKARADSKAAAVTINEGIADKTDAAMLRPEYIVNSVDVFRGLEIRAVDPSDWHGEAGQVIRIHAEDEAQVTVVITDGDGLVIEQGLAARHDGGEWTYATIAIATDGPRIFATARELPEHLTEVRFGT
jgi:hypothetical protein